MGRKNIWLYCDELLRRIKGYKLASMVVGIAEESDMIVAENATYPFGSFISDVGGAAGLILGMNILGLIKLAKRCYSVIDGLTIINNIIKY